MAARPLIESSIHIDASAATVWSIVSDLARMSEWSPQCAKTVVLGGTTKLGAKALNVNRQGWKTWPSTSTVVQFETNRKIAFRITENRTVWSFEIAPADDGVDVIQRREAKDGKTTAISAVLIDRFLGGREEFEKSLETGMHETLTKIKAAAEHP